MTEHRPNLPANPADALLAGRSLPDLASNELAATMRRCAQVTGELRVMVRIGVKTWPGFEHRILVYLLDGEDQSTGEIPVYAPDREDWYSLPVDTIRRGLAQPASKHQVETAREAIEYVLGAKVRVMKRR